MRNYKLILYILLPFALVFESCKDYLDVNENPNQATSSTPELVLTNALNVTAGRLGHNEIGAFWSGQWSPPGSVSGFVPEKNYDITSTFRTGIWSGTYDNLADYKYVEEEALKQKKVSIAGIAQVMKAFNYQILVDTYNNVPYTDALKGTAAIRPTYTEGSLVYDSLVITLNSAIENLKAEFTSDNPSPGANDIFFQGDMSKWLKFANTLKLRLLLRQINVAAKQGYIVEEVNKIKANGFGFIGEDETVYSNPGYLKSAGKMNPFYESYGFTSGDGLAGNHDFYAYSDFFVTLLQETNDPARLDRLAYVASTDKQYRGVPFGEGSDEFLYSKISGFGPAFLPTTSAASSTDLFKRPQVVMTSSESFFLQSEAVVRGLLEGDAKELYQKGITESYKLLKVEAEEMTAEQAAEAYYTQAIENVGWDASTDKIAAIITQKWIALANFNGFEAWTEFRRTGFPKVPLSTKAISNQHPARLLYPLSEYSNNTANVQAQGTINQFTSKIFWMP